MDWRDNEPGHDGSPAIAVMGSIAMMIVMLALCIPVWVAEHYLFMWLEQ